MGMIGISCTAGCCIATVLTGIIALVNPSRLAVTGLICCGAGLLLSVAVSCFNLGYEFRKSEEDGE